MDRELYVNADDEEDWKPCISTWTVIYGGKTKQGQSLPSVATGSAILVGALLGLINASNNN